MANQPEVPLLVIAYQRVDTVSQILDAALSGGTTTVFISIDAPKIQDYSSSSNYEALIELINHYRDRFPTFATRFLPTNQGCALHVLSSIDWAFESVEELIVLEDDCIPSSDFFVYVKDGLEVMRRQPDIALICGTQHSPSELSQDQYYKSKYSLTWGWATTRNSWQELRSSMINAAMNFPLGICDLDFERIYWREGSRRAYEGFVDVWDTPLVNHLRVSSKYALLPKENLVMNVGNDSAATHMKGESKWLFNESGIYRSGQQSTAQINEASDAWLSKYFYRIRPRHLITTRLTRLKDSMKKSPRENLIARWLAQ